MSKRAIRRAGVLGAGVMGAQIAAHLVNAGIETVLFDLPAKEGDPNATAIKAVQLLTKLKPEPLGDKALCEHILAANYDTGLHLLEQCDIIIEAVAERLDIKHSLYEKIIPHIGPDAIFASNTSGLSINKLSECLPEELAPRFCGVHFFNPPRYMHLVELIPSEKTEAKLLDDLESFLTTTLGKGVLRAKDTPNFIANRVGVYSMLVTMHHAKAFNLGFDLVDGLTGSKLGRAKSATFRTLDVVGIDTFNHVVNTSKEQLTDDPWHAIYDAPDWMMGLIKQGALGQKSKKGVFEKVGKVINVLDIESGKYRPADQKPDKAVLAILKTKDVSERFEKLHASDHPQAQFLWACFRDLFHYCAVHLPEIADNARDLDLAIRWGFGWNQGPFEIWQAAGWQQVARWVSEDIEAGSALAKTPLPNWVLDDNRQGVYHDGAAYSPAINGDVPRSELPVYQRQLFKDPVITEAFDEGETIFQNAVIRLWHQGDGVAILSFKTKMNTINGEVLNSILQAVDIAERDFKALVLWQRQGEHFSAGADLAEMLEGMAAGKVKEITEMIATFQATSMRLRYSLIPTVSAVRGFTFGGGCELSLHCDRLVAAFETYIGLVEVGVGLLPAGGGCKEFTLRAFQESRGDDPFRDLQQYFQMIAMGEVAAGGLQAKAKGFLRPADVIVYNTHELLHVAKQQALALAESGYRPPLSPHITVPGKAGIATIRMMLVNMLEGRQISEHDFVIANHVATVLCGGEIEEGSRVDENWLLHLERQAFIKLLSTEKTQARISHTLKTGKPLRN